MKDIVIPLPKNVKDKLKKFRLQYQDERIQKFIEACKGRFFETHYLCVSAFVDAICGHTFNETYDPHKVYISNDFDVMLKNKENSDIFFSFFTHPYDVLYEHQIWDWASQSQARLNAWNRLSAKIDKYCQKHYGCPWGEQNVEYVEPIPKYLPLAWDKTKEENMVNRPLYYKGELIGFVKKVTNVKCVTGQRKVWDEDEFEYIYLNVYKPYKSSILFYGIPKKVEGIKFFEKDGLTYILNESLINYELHQDRINIIK